MSFSYISFIMRFLFINENDGIRVYVFGMVWERNSSVFIFSSHSLLQSHKKWSFSPFCFLLIFHFVGVFVRAVEIFLFFFIS